MVSVNQSWTSFQNFDRDSDYGKKIQAVLEHANFSFLCSKAVELRRQEEGCPDTLDTLACSVDTTKFASGTFNVVVALDFSDSVQWVARIPLPQDGYDEQHVSSTLLSEICTMKLVRVDTKIPVPQVFAWDVTADNPLGYAYLLMEALPGKVLDSRLAFSVPGQHKRKVAAQFARYIYELSTIRYGHIGRLSFSSSFSKSGADEPDKIGIFEFPVEGWEGIGPFTTSFEYFYFFRKGQTRAILQNHDDEEEWEAAAWFLEKSLSSMISQEHIRGPFPLCHLDLHYNNMLFDDDYNITGIIDWSSAQTVPVERFLVSPEFIAPPAARAEDKQSIFAFRDMFAEELEKIEREKLSSFPEGEEKEGEERRLLYRLVGSPLSEVVYRCTCSYSWRAISDARLVLRLVYGDDAKWEDIQKYYRDGSA